MINFALTTDGSNLLASAVAGTNPVIIDSIVLKDSGGNAVYTVTENNFSGAVVADGSSLGDYIVLQFEDSRSNSYTVQNIEIKSGDVVVAESEAISLTKNAGTTANFRVSAQFDGASKCACKNTVVNLPYATQSRDGIIRFAKSTGELHKERTVYSAQDVEALVAAGVSSTDKYVPWDVSEDGAVIKGELTASKIKVSSSDLDAESAVAITIGESLDGTPALDVDGYITGTAVASSPTFGEDLWPQPGDALVNETYIRNIYSDYVTSSDHIPTRNLVSGEAVDSYVSDKLSHYVTIDTEEEITGKKTFSSDTVFEASVAAPAYIGDGVYNTYDASTWSSSDGSTSTSDSKLPTVSAVRAAINAGDSAITAAYQKADGVLQSQIDALNAGQNLADMVGKKEELDSLDTSNLENGDKVQVLTDEEHENASTVYRLVKTESTDGGETVEWVYIGNYGSDSYTKAEVDEAFVSKEGLVQEITEEVAVTDNAPSAAAVWNLVNNVTTSLDNYVTLDTDQTITGAKTFENIVKVSDPGNENHYIHFGSATSSSSGTTWSTIECANLDKTAYADAAFECSGNNHNVNYFHKLNRLNEDGTTTIGTSNVLQSIQNHYGVIASDTCLTTGEAYEIPHSFAEAQIAAGDEYKENYQERIRVRKTVAVDNPDDVNTYIDLYADHITTVGDDIHFKTLVYEQGTDGVLTTSTEELLTISNEKGVYSTKFAGGYVIDNESYVFGSAGSLTTDFAITKDADDNHAPTSKAVKSYVSEAIAGAQEAVITSISNINAVGSMGLFLYTEAGDQKSYGELIDGSFLKPVGMSLPNSGQISYKSVALEDPLSGSWKLLSVAMKRTATDPCLVLAQKVSE